MKFKYYWEDFKLGEKVQLGDVKVSKEHMIDFAKKYDPQGFHVDEELAAKSVFGGLIASGWLTCALVMRLACDAQFVESASLASPGMDNIRWVKPVRPGSIIHGYRTTIQSRPSDSRPEMGIIKSLFEGVDQDGDLVVSMEGIGLFSRKGS